MSKKNDLVRFGRLNNTHETENQGGEKASKKVEEVEDG